MKIFLTILLFVIFSSNNLIGQEGSKIDLDNVNVGSKRLPSIFLFGNEYTARNRDKLLRGILKSQFYRPDLEIIINLEEFISKRAFIFKHTGPIEIIINGKKLKNQNKYNSDSFIYQNSGESRILNLLNDVKNIKIDSSLNGILKRKVLRAEIISLEKEIKKLTENINADVLCDTIFVSNKYREKTLKKLLRTKNKHERKFNELKTIKISIATN